jgi:DNA-binding transcriptional MocR family regulator
MVAEALERLEYVADAYLSVSTPVALAAPRLIAASVDVQRAILDRCRRNLGRLLELVPTAPSVTVLTPAGGWTVPLRIPSVIDEEELVIALLDEGVAVHPGYFYDFPGSGYLVVSLLPQPEVFAGGVERLLRRVEGWL